MKATLGLLLALLIGGGLYVGGRMDGHNACIAEHTAATQQAEHDAKAKAVAVIKRSTATGRGREVDRAATDARFNQLAEEARHAPPDPVDSCVLPDERLRLWAAANAGGADGGTAPAEPHSAAAASAAAEIGSRARSGGQPPRGGARLPPTGGADVPAAAVSGDQPQ